MLALLRSLGLDCGSCFHAKMLVRINQSNVMALMQLQKAQQVTRGFRGPGRVECREGLLGSGANQVNHGPPRLALRSVGGNTNPVPNRNQAGDSILNVLQKPSRGIIYQGHKEVVKRKLASPSAWTPQQHREAPIRTDLAWADEPEGLRPKGLAGAPAGTGRKQYRKKIKSAKGSPGFVPACVTTMSGEPGTWNAAHLCQSAAARAQKGGTPRERRYSVPCAAAALSCNACCGERASLRESFSVDAAS